MTSQPKVAVFGAGRWGMNHVRNFHELGALAAVVDPSEHCRDKAKEVVPGVPIYTDGEQVYADPAIQGVVFATPAARHAQDAEAAFAAGKDVFAEKPMALNVEDAEKMVSAAEKADQLLMVGHLLLYQPAIGWIRRQIQDGLLGDIWHIETRRLNLGKVRDIENVFWSFAPHDLAVIHSLLGEPALQSARAVGQKAVQKSIEDQVHADYVFDSGATAHVHAAWFWPTKLRATTVIGSKKMVVYDEIAQTVTLYDSSINPETLETSGAESQIIDIADEAPLKNECQHFLDCIHSRQQPLSHGKHGLEVIRMLAAASADLE